MSGVERIGHLDAAVDRIGGGNRTRHDELVERLPFDELHGEKR